MKLFKDRFANKPMGILSSLDLKTAKGKALYWTMFAILLLVCAGTLIPAIWMFLSAFKTPQEMYSSTAFFPKDLTFSGAIAMIKEAWEVLELQRSIINTFIISLGNLVTKILVCGLAGYVLSKLRVSGTRVVFTLVVWTMMMPGVVRTVSSYMSYLSFPFVIDDKLNIGTNYNILNTYIPLWLGAAADSFTIILFKNNFDAIPTSLVEAARIDGCSDFKIFYKIMLPIALPVVTYVAIGALSGVWGDYLNPYILLKDVELMPMPTRLMMLKGESDVTQNIYMMGLLFSSVPTILIFVLFQKYIVGGINVGGVKG